MAMEPRPPALAAEAHGDGIGGDTEVPHQTPARPSALAAEARAMAMAMEPRPPAQAAEATGKLAMARALAPPA